MNRYTLELAEVGVERAWKTLQKSVYETLDHE